MADRLFRYIGPADERSFTESDFARHGINDQGDVTFNGANAKIARLSDGAAQFLAGLREPFKLVEDEDAAEHEIATAYANALERQAEVDMTALAMSAQRSGMRPEDLEALEADQASSDAEGGAEAEDGPPSGSAGSVATDAGATADATASGGTEARSSKRSTAAKSKA